MSCEIGSSAALPLDFGWRSGPDNTRRPAPDHVGKNDQQTFFGLIPIDSSVPT
jgi:hypothetical protein